MDRGRAAPISIPFKHNGEKWWVGLYKYVATPAGEQHAKDVLWLEAGRGDAQISQLKVEADARTMDPSELDRIREAFVAKWSASRSPKA